MSRKLFRQTANEWRTNFWLALELLLVSVIVWYIADYIYAFAATRLEPTGFDSEHVYQLSYRTVAPENPRFIDYGEDAKDQNAANLRNLVNALRQRPGIEAVSVSMAAEPYSQNFMGYGIWNEQDTLEIGVGARFCSPEHLKVMKYKSSDPSVSIEELMEALRKGDLLISRFDDSNMEQINMSSVNIDGVTSDDVVGRIFHMNRDSVTNYRIAGVLEPVKRTTIEAGAPISLFQAIDESTDKILSGRTINVRVSPEADHDFISKFNADRERLYTFGNTYISDIKSYEDVRISADHHAVVEMRKYVACMVFMLVSVFLGLLGTFWFRTQQRIGEIAIRKVSGATNSSVFRRLLSEGMILLIVVTPLAIVGDWIIAKYELNQYFYGYFSAGRFIFTVAVTFLLMTLMIVGGIWFPAHRAMKVDPARALADE